MKLGIVLRKYRLMKKCDLRTQAKELGIAAATLLRIEQGKDCDAKTLAKILNWLMGAA